MFVSERTIRRRMERDGCDEQEIEDEVDRWVENQIQDRKDRDLMERYEVQNS